MPRTKECDYCGDDIEPGTGTMLIHNDGSTTNFCSSKCENNADLGREARNLEWTDSERGADDTESTEDDAETETVEADTGTDDTEESAVEDSAASEPAAEEEEDSDETEEAQA